MHPIARTALALIVAATAAATFEQARNSITAEEIRAHLYFLSQDDLRGRAPGTRGGELAASYIASQFLRMGLQAGGNGDFFQPVPIRGVTTDPTTLSVGFDVGGRRLTARYPDDVVVWSGVPQSVVQVSGELVFVGYGIDAPTWGWDDFKNRDLNGKVLVFLVGDPPSPPDEPRLFDGRALTYYGRWTYKLEEARRRGATGALLVHRDEAAGYGWDVVQNSWTGEQFQLDGDTEGPPLVLQGWLSNEYARTLLADAGLDLDELYVRAARRDFRPVATGVTVRSRINSRTRRFETRNVVGVLPGSDPDLQGEAVIFTSHYDHLGVGTPRDGDSIYNGAYDNASGVSVLLEVADAFSRLEPRPARTTVFIATAAEEAGLLGAEHYVRNPLVPLERTVAALNIDGASVWGETDDAVVLGAERSTLGELVRLRAEEAGLMLRPDPAPERGSFFRSDHFPFARAGVPVLSVQHGTAFRGRPPGWGEQTLADYNRERYHQPSDEYDASFNLAGAVQQGRLLFSIGYDVAGWDRVAEWHEGSEFKAARDRTAMPDR